MHLPDRIARKLRRVTRFIPRSQGQLDYLLKRIWIRVRVVMRLVAREAEWKVPFRYRHPRWWRRGFLSRSAIVYDLEHNDPSLYVSDVQRYLRTRHMVHARLQDIINNKLSTHLLLENLAIATPRLAGVYSRGMVHLYPTERRIDASEFLEQMADGERLFFKPLGGAEGKKLYSVRRTSTGVRVNGEDMDVASARHTVMRPNSPQIIEGLVEQHPEQAALFPETTNTLRLLTMLDPETREPFILIAVQRIGSATSGVVDNWSRGGLSARIDLETGRLGKAARLPQQQAELQWFSRHPDTDAMIEGHVVPHWPDVVEIVHRAARSIAFLEYVGWDIIVAPDQPVVLEANINSGMNVLQVHQPLLADPRAHAYLTERRVIGRRRPSSAGSDGRPSRRPVPLSTRTGEP